MTQPTIYVSSKTTHVQLWKYHRTRGNNIISSWLDIDKELSMEEIGQNYWPIWLTEAANADYLIFYAAPGDHNHASCLLEIAACLFGGGTILHVGVSETMKTENGKLADFTYHPRWHRLVDLEMAFVRASAYPVLPEGDVTDLPGTTRSSIACFNSADTGTSFGVFGSEF